MGSRQGPGSALCQQPGPAALAQPGDGGHGQAPRLREYFLEHKWNPCKKQLSGTPPPPGKGLPAAGGASPLLLRYAVRGRGPALVLTFEP